MQFVNPNFKSPDILSGLGEIKKSKIDLSGQCDICGNQNTQITRAIVSGNEAAKVGSCCFPDSNALHDARSGKTYGIPKLVIDVVGKPPTINNPYFHHVRTAFGDKAVEMPLVPKFYW